MSKKKLDLKRERVSEGKIEIYKSAQFYFWRLRASNGRIIATGNEEFSSKQKCKQNINSVLYYIINSIVVDKTVKN